MISSSRRRSARLRLTLLYAGLFLLLGTLVLGVTYALAPSSQVHVTVHAAPTGRTRIRIPGAVHQIVVQPHSSDLKQQLLAISWVVLLITAAAAALVGWFLAGRFLRPLREMTDRARTISAGNLSERLARAGPDDEFKQLGDTFDDVLARLEASFEAQRRFVANAAHELRTPLTLERTLLQVALAAPDATAATLRATFEELLTIGREQERLLDALLTLASSERGLDQLATVDLASAAERAVTAYRGEADRRSVRLEASLAPATIAGDGALIERLIANLLDNAVRYNHPGGSVAVQVATSGRRAILSVANTGPIVPPDQVTRLFEPFTRLGRERAGTVEGHHGLGLSIVRAIASAHGAELAAEAREGGGLEVVISFPAAPRA